MREEPLVRGLAQRQVEPDVVRVDADAIPELLGIAGQDRARRGRQQRDADVARAHHLPREGGEGVAELHAEGRRAELLRHAEHGLDHRHHLGRNPAGEHRPELLGQRCIERVGIHAGGVGRVRHRAADHLLHVLRDRLDVPLPHREGLLQPLRTAPRERRPGRGRQDGGLVEPDIREANGLRDRPGLGVGDDGVASGIRARELLTRDIADHLPVDGSRRAR